MFELVRDYSYEYKIGGKSEWEEEREEKSRLTKEKNKKLFSGIGSVEKFKTL